MEGAVHFGRRSTSAVVIAGSLAALFVTHAAAAQFEWTWLRPLGPVYALDGASRAPDAECEPERMVRYRSSTLRTTGVVRGDPAFVARLPELDRVVREVSIEHYGRAPRRMRTLGGYNCRTVRHRPDRLSEHALGNALDVQGFELPALRRGEVAPAGLPRRLRRAFTVTVGHDWSADGLVGAYHGVFLRALVDRLVAADVFRVILGPAHPQHRTHFHFDMSPYRYVRV